MHGGWAGRQSSGGGGSSGSGKVLEALKPRSSSRSVASPCTTRWDRYKRPRRAVWSSRLKTAPWEAWQRPIADPANSETAATLREERGELQRRSGCAVLRASRHTAPGRQKRPQRRSGERSGAARDGSAPRALPARAALSAPPRSLSCGTCRLFQWAGWHGRSLLT